MLRFPTEGLYQNEIDHIIYHYGHLLPRGESIHGEEIGEIIRKENPEDEETAVFAEEHVDYISKNWFFYYYVAKP